MARLQTFHVNSKPSQASVFTLQAARIMGETLAVDTEESERLAIARSFCRCVVEAWWEEISWPGEKLRAQLSDVEFAYIPSSAVASAQAMATNLAALEPEEVAFAIGSAYAAMLPQIYRSEFGVYYTPPELVARLIGQASNAGVDWTTCRILDPACGGGAFLAPVARQILATLPDVTPAILVRNVATRLKGYEIDPFAAWLSQVTLEAVMLETCRAANAELPVCVEVCDSLRRRLPRERFDLVIGNPPYGRVTLPPALRETFRDGLYGHANLYGLFTDLAGRLTRRNGVIAYVTPTSFLAGGYFRNLRRLIAKNARPFSIDFVVNRKGIFDGVLQETLLATYKRNSKSSRALVSEIEPDGRGGVTCQSCGHFVLPPSATEPWIIARSPEQVDLVARLRRMPDRLRDWGYKVSTGPLVWNRFKEQLQDRPAKCRVPLIWAESVTSDGHFEFRAKRKNHRPYFEIKAGDDWLVTRAPCVLLQRTTAKEQSRRLIAADLPQSFLDSHGGAVVIENHLNMLRPVSIKPRVEPAVLAGFLNSRAADRAFRCVSGSVAVSAFELEALPLPSPDDLDELAKLIVQRADRDMIEAECDRLLQGKEQVSV